MIFLFYFILSKCVWFFVSSVSLFLIACCKSCKYLQLVAVEDRTNYEFQCNMFSLILLVDYKI